jgi:hypothetical protein
VIQSAEVGARIEQVPKTVHDNFSNMGNYIKRLILSAIASNFGKCVCST